MNPFAAIVDVARKNLGVREITENQAPEIIKFWQDTNYKDGEKNKEPWCCAFVVYCVTEAAKSGAFKLPEHPPQMASCRELLDWAQDPKNGCTVFTPKDVLAHKHGPRAGDIVCFIPHFSHVGIIREDYDGTGFIQTIEGNTNVQGEREGDGVYAKQRRMDLAGYYIRLNQPTS